MEPREELDVVREIKDIYARTLAVTDLVLRINGEFKIQALQEAFDTALEIKDSYERAWVLAYLLPQLNNETKIQALKESLAAVREIRDEYFRASALAYITFRLDDNLKMQAAWEMMLAASRKRKDQVAREERLVYREEYALGMLGASEVKDDRKTQTLRESLVITHEIENENQRAVILENLLPHLEQEHLTQALVITRGIENEDRRIVLLTHLIPRLGERRLTQALVIAREIKDEYRRTDILVNLVPRLERKFLTQEALAEAREALEDISPSDTPDDIPTYRSKKAAKEITFTAYHAKEGNVESWHTLLVYAHIFAALAKVQEDSKRFDDQIKLPKETTSKSSTLIARGTELTIVPSCEGVTFNPERVNFKWIEDFHRVDFRFKADQSLSGDAAKGSIDIYVGPLIIGTLKFAMLFSDKDAQPIPDHEEHATMYGRDDVFISYSRKDSDVARTFKTVLEGTGLDVFLDVDNLRSGQLWEDELKRRIECAKIFQIFWSANYSQSENCKLEWEYALQQNKDEGYIRPVFWEKPISPNPPEELNKFNFKYVELKV